MRMRRRSVKIMMRRSRRRKRRKFLDNSWNLISWCSLGWVPGLIVIDDP